MAQGLEIDLKDIVLSNSTFGPNEIDQLTRAISGDVSRVPVLRDSVGELEASESLTPAMAVRLGVCYYLLGRTTRAIETLRSSDGSALALFYLAAFLVCHGRVQRGDCQLQRGQGRATTPINAPWRLARRSAYMGDAAAALATLDALSGAIEQTAEYLYQRGATVAALGGNPTEVVALYERAVATDPRHPGALFGLALESDRRGDDERALELCERAVQGYPTHVGSLLNLGLMYEDRLRVRVGPGLLSADTRQLPVRSASPVVLQDAAASGDMFFDEEAQKRNERIESGARHPGDGFRVVGAQPQLPAENGGADAGRSDPHLRTRIALEQEFRRDVAHRNPRHAALPTGWTWACYVDRRAEPEVPVDLSDLSPDEQAVLERPIADLNLSVRARKCMVRLGMSTLGELVRKTGDDLLECKNFGVTSLNEVREKLTQLNLKLRGD